MNPNAPRDAPAPFDKAGADVILRTSDNVDFRVFRWILEDASSVFADMFALPQPATPPASKATRGTRPEPIVVSEDSETLASLLRLYYPLPTPPSFSTFDQAKKALVAADKYRLTVAATQVTDAVIVHIKANPLRAYAFAIRSNLEDLTRLSAFHFLSVTDTAVYSDELEDISGGAYQRLLAYRCACTAAMDQFVRKKWIPSGDDKRCMGWSTCCDGVQSMVCYDTDSYPTTNWFTGYWDRVSAMLRSTPTPEVVKNPVLVEDALQGAYGCSYCGRTRPHQHLQSYSTLLAAEVERIILEVPLEIK